MNPEVQQAIDNINQYILENHNNEITANILNPILIELANLFDLVGDLSELNTAEKDSVVSAINWLITQINSGIEIHVGTDDPNDIPPDNYAVGDLYSRLNVLGDPYKIYMYNGVEWGEIQRVINDLIISNDSTWSSEKISQAIQGDRFETIPTISLSDNDITITNSSWWIQGVNYNLIPDFEDTIPYTSEEGLFRKDIIVAVASNNFVRIQGVESDTNPFEPTVPPNTLLVTQIDVFDDSIGEPTEPIIGSNYIPKQSERWTLSTNITSADIATPIIINGNLRNWKFQANIGTGTFTIRRLDVGGGTGFYPFATIWDGMKVSFANVGVNDITIKHFDTSLPSDPQTYKILLPNSEDVILKTGETINLSYDLAHSVFRLSSFGKLFSGGESLTLEQARQNGDVIEGIIFGNEEFDKEGNRKAFAQISDVEDALEDYIQEPTTDGTSGQVLTTDGSGGRSWTTVSGGITADQVSYDNTASGLLAETVQEAVDEVQGNVEQEATDRQLAIETAGFASRTGTEIHFDKWATYDSYDSPSDGDFSYDLTNAVVGMIQVAYHEDSLVPTFSQAGISVIITGEYQPELVNKIAFELIALDRILINIRAL